MAYVYLLDMYAMSARLFGVSRGFGAIMTIISLLLQNYGNPYYDIDFWRDDNSGTVTVGEVWLHKVPQQEAGGGRTYPVTVSMVSTRRGSRSKRSRQPEHVSHRCLELTPPGQAEP